MVKILLADSHVLFRRGFASVLQLYPEFTVVGEATDGLEAIAMANHVRPDVLVIDSTMLNGNGKINKSYREILAEFKALVLTNMEEDEVALKILEAGARGYLSKETSHEALIEAMRAIVTGQVIVSSAMASKIADMVRRTKGKWNEEDLEPLSKRQTEVLYLVAEGLTNKEIANKLFLSEATIKSHMRIIMEKVKAKNRGQAVARASKAGLLNFAITLILAKACSVLFASVDSLVF